MKQTGSQLFVCVSGWRDGLYEGDNGLILLWYLLIKLLNCFIFVRSIYISAGFGDHLHICFPLKEGTRMLD